ncbi:MAG: VOC family protein [Actinomycetota bacterium]|nr:VOC family protein [Acidimicrobiia bacterium]MDQ3293056.1 VOC family protein [Actinomycetota bacterium]
MAIRIETIGIDASDPSALARWWAEALRWRITEGDDEEFLVVPPEGSPEAGILELLFCRVPEGKVVKNRLHLDLRPDDQDAEVARFETLGATRASVGQGDDVTWVVMADPEGNEFCILRTLPPDDATS